MYHGVKPTRYAGILFRSRLEEWAQAGSFGGSSDRHLPDNLCLSDRAWRVETPPAVASAYDAARNERFGLGATA